MAVDIEKVEVEMRYFAPWFEKQLSYIYQYDLVHVYAGYRMLKTNINNLLSLSATCRRSIGLLPATQSARVIKICDQIDTLIAIEAGYSLHDNCFITQTDIEFLKTLRNKIRIIDDMAASGKLTKSSGFEATGKDVRLVVRSVLECLDNLDEHLNLQSNIIAHFSYLREATHRPVMNFISGVSRLFNGNIDLTLESRRAMIADKKRLDIKVSSCADDPAVLAVSHLMSEAAALEETIATSLQPAKLLLEKLMESSNGQSYGALKSLLTALTVDLSQVRGTSQLVRGEWLESWVERINAGISILRASKQSPKHKSQQPLMKELSGKIVESIDVEYIMAVAADWTDTNKLLLKSCQSLGFVDARNSIASVEHINAQIDADECLLLELQQQFHLLQDLVREICAMEINVIVDLIEPVEFASLLQVYGLSPC